MLVFNNIKKVVSRPLGALGLVLVVMLLVSAISADFIAPYDSSKIMVRDRFQTPSQAHLLGTDQLGRDLFSRALIGGQVAMKVAMICMSLSLIFGIVLGMLAGIGSKRVDNVITLFFDVVRSFPTIIFALAVVTVFGPSVKTIILVIVIGYSTIYGRVTRTLTMSLRSSEYVLAAQSMGASTARVIFSHILPNIIGSLLILASMDVPLIITIEAGLSFMGLGVRPPTPSWGNILNDGYIYINNTMWPLIAGGAPIILTTLGFTFLGETMRDVFDPKLEKMNL